MRRKAQQGAGSPTFCWHCGRQLRRAPGKGKGKGLFFFEVVVDKDDRQHRVHGDCVKDACEFGEAKPSNQGDHP